MVVEMVVFTILFLVIVDLRSLQQQEELIQVVELDQIVILKVPMEVAVS